MQENITTQSKHEDILLKYHSCHFDGRRHSSQSHSLQLKNLVGIHYNLVFDNIFSDLVFLTANELLSEGSLFHHYSIFNNTSVNDFPLLLHYLPLSVLHCPLFCASNCSVLLNRMQ